MAGWYQVFISGRTAQAEQICRDNDIIGEGDVQVCRQIKTWDWRAGRAGGVNMATAGTNNNTNNTQHCSYNNNTTTVPASVTTLDWQVLTPTP